MVVLLVLTCLACVAALAYTQNWLPWFPYDDGRSQWLEKEKTLKAAVRRALEDRDRATTDKGRYMQDSERLLKERDAAAADRDRLRREAETGARTIHDLRRELFPDDMPPTSDVPALAGWAAQAHRVTWRQKEDLAEKLAAREEELRVTKETLLEEQEDHEKTRVAVTVAKGDARAKELALKSERTAHEKTKAENAQLQEEWTATLRTANERIQDLGRQVAGLRENVPLRIVNSGSPLQLVWVIVFYRDGDGDIAAKTYTREQTGGPLASGESKGLTEGVAFVAMTENPLNAAQVSPAYHATRGGSGSLSFRPPW
jgi:hypothetical protein